MLDTSLCPPPSRGRTLLRPAGEIRLADMDARGRLRLDAVARFLQDIAIDDVQETGWAICRTTSGSCAASRIDVVRQFLDDRAVELTTWCSSVAAIAAGRRWSVTGDAGRQIEVDSVWIHLDRDDARRRGRRLRRLRGGGPRGAAPRRKLELPRDPPGDAARPSAGPCARRTSTCRAGASGRRRLLAGGRGAAAREGRQSIRGLSLRAELDYRQPMDFDETIELAVFEDSTTSRSWTGRR